MAPGDSADAPEDKAPADKHSTADQMLFCLDSLLTFIQGLGNVQSAL